MQLFPKPPVDVATYPSAVLGIRTWRVEEKGGPLRAAFFGDSAWQVGVTKAVCKRCDVVPNAVWDDSDHRACRCGMHAYHSMSHLLAGQKADVTRLVRADDVIGIVAGKGNLQAHADGWRTEEAQVLGLLAPPRPYLYICPFCEGAATASPHCSCRGSGVLAGASKEVGLVRTEFDHDAAREMVEAVAAHHGVRVFDTLEEMMEFGLSIAAPVPEDLCVPHPPIWARGGFEGASLASYLVGLVAMVVTMALFGAQGIETIFSSSHHLVMFEATWICGFLAVACGAVAFALRSVQHALRSRARALWRAYAAGPA